MTLHDGNPFSKNLECSEIQPYKSVTNSGRLVADFGRLVADFSRLVAISRRVTLGDFWGHSS